LAVGRQISITQQINGVSGSVGGSGSGGFVCANLPHPSLVTLLRFVH
jgi:hypothetical protein